MAGLVHPWLGAAPKDPCPGSVHVPTFITLILSAGLGQFLREKLDYENTKSNVLID